MSNHKVGDLYLNRIKALFVKKGNAANRSSLLDFEALDTSLVAINASDTDQSYLLGLQLRYLQACGLVYWDDAIRTATYLLWPIGMSSSWILIVGRQASASSRQL